MSSGPSVLERARVESWSDEEVVKRVLAGQKELFEIIMRRHNTRLYRVARAILRDDSEAEDVMQDAYVRAYQHLNQFAGAAKFSTWLTRIAVHEALARVQRRSRCQSLDSASDSAGDKQMLFASDDPTPEQQLQTSELRALLEQSILGLPEPYRAVLMLRDVEELNTSETAETLDLTEDNVKVRLHRARALLRKHLFARVGASRTSAFPFPATRCDRVVNTVFARLAALEM